MKKVVCPKCGGTLIIESLGQYGEQRNVCKNGKIRKKVKKVDQGSMDFHYLFCGSCGHCFRENEFDVHCDRVELMEVDNE